MKLLGREIEIGSSVLVNSTVKETVVQIDKTDATFFVANYGWFNANGRNINNIDTVTWPTVVVEFEKGDAVECRDKGENIWWKGWLFLTELNDKFFCYVPNSETTALWDEIRVPEPVEPREYWLNIYDNDTRRAYTSEEVARIIFESNDVSGEVAVHFKEVLKED